MRLIYIFLLVLILSESYAGIGQSQSPKLDGDAVNPFKFIGDTIGNIVDDRNSKLKNLLEEKNIESALNLYKTYKENSFLPSDSLDYKEWKEFDNELLNTLITQGNDYLKNRDDYTSLLLKIQDYKNNIREKSDWKIIQEDLQKVSDVILRYENYKVFTDNNAVNEEIKNLKKNKEQIVEIYLNDIQGNLITYYKEDRNFRSSYPINISSHKFDFMDETFLKNICSVGGDFAKSFSDDFQENFVSNERDKLISCYSSQTLAKGSNNLLDLLDASKKLYSDNLLTEIPSDVLTIYKVKNGKQEFDYIIKNDIDIETKDIPMSEIKKDSSKFQIYIVPKSVSVKTNVVQRDTKSSRYQSGVDRKPNSQYEIARMEVFEAQNQLSQLKMEAAWATGWAALANLAAQIAVDSKIDTKKSNFANTQQYLETPIYQTYSYSVSKVKSVKTLDLDIYINENNTLKKTNYALKDEKDFELAFDMHPEDRSAGQYSSDAEISNFEKSEIELILNQVFDSNLNTNLKFTKVDKIEAGKLETKVTNNSKDKQNTKISLNDNRTNITSDKRMQSVVVVYQPNGSIGSGFFVKPNYIVTNYHVIEGAPFLEIKTFDGQKIRGVIEKFDITKDLALVKVDTIGIPAKIFSKGEVILGENVFAIGHPKGLEFSISKGITSAIRKMNTVTGSGGDEILLIQTDTPINPGNSGGPLYMGDEVVGVNVQKIARVEVEGLNFSIHYEELLSFLQ